MTHASLIRGFLLVTFLFAGAADAAARNEAAVGQCGLTFVNTGNSCEQAYGGAGADPPNGEKLDTCWNKATSDYNSCMDKALAAPPASGAKIDPSKRNLLDPTIRDVGTDAVTKKP